MARYLRLVIPTEDTVQSFFVTIGRNLYQVTTIPGEPDYLGHWELLSSLPVD